MSKNYLGDDDVDVTLTPIPGTPGPTITLAKASTPWWVYALGAYLIFGRKRRRR
jgi:hypothetical protein